MGYEPGRGLTLSSISWICRDGPAMAPRTCKSNQKSAVPCSILTSRKEINAKTKLIGSCPRRYEPLLTLSVIIQVGSQRKYLQFITFPLVHFLDAELIHPSFRVKENRPVIGIDQGE